MDTVACDCSSNQSFGDNVTWTNDSRTGVTSGTEQKADTRLCYQGRMVTANRSVTASEGLELHTYLMSAPRKRPGEEDTLYRDQVAAEERELTQRAAGEQP